MKPVRRRTALLYTVKNILIAIDYVKKQKQVANMDRLERFMAREHNLTAKETEKQLHYAVEDGLIMSYTAISKKGTNAGSEQEGFKPPDSGDVVRDGHDWYCFECHKPGEVLLCSTCWRVFHPKCAQEDDDVIDDDDDDEEDNIVKKEEFVCAICVLNRRKCPMTKKYLNMLLGYTVLRMKEKTKELHKITFKEEEETMGDWRRYIYKHMDINRMEHKVNNHKYKCVDEFLSDAKSLFHMVALGYGEFSDMSDLAKIMVKECQYELEELLQCRHCYYMSNAKPDDWFCQPCEPPHELVYAKQRGYSHWPAKVIRKIEDDSKYDVRFFGGYHQRALVPKPSVKPITANMKDITVKRTQGFVKACAELQEHQRLLKQLQDGERRKDDDDDDDGEEEEDNRSNEDNDDEEETNTTESNEVNEDMSGKKDTEVTSTGVTSPKRTPTTPEDTHVTSSEDNLLHQAVVLIRPLNLVQTTTTATQTRKLCENRSNKFMQTDPVKETEPTVCDCESKFQNRLSEALAERNDKLKEEKDKLVQEVTERLQKDFEEDKQQAVSRAMSNMQRELEKARRQAEDKCKEQYMEEMRKLAQKHKDAISATKKKQWCYNCEEEAMYHCCWNTSYCSIKCQQEHWHKEHKRVCRRKRN